MTEQDVNDSPPVIGVLKDLLVFLVRYGLFLFFFITLKPRVE